jgi:hypothetical protein
MKNRVILSGECKSSKYSRHAPYKFKVLKKLIKLLKRKDDGERKIHN